MEKSMISIPHKRVVVKLKHRYQLICLVFHSKKNKTNNLLNQKKKEKDYSAIRNEVSEERFQ